MSRLFAPISAVYPETVATLVPNWLAGLHEWQAQQSDHYRFKGVDLNYYAAEHEEALRHLIAPDVLRHIEGVTSRTWGVPFSPTFRLEAHWLGPGDYVAPHSDAGPREARAVVTFPSNDLCGGDLVFHGAEVDQAIPPRANEGAVFICSTDSVHSVTRVQRGARYSICYRFELPGQPDPTETARPPNEPRR